MATVEIYWDDLTERKKVEIIRVMGDNCNYDLFPIAVISNEEEEDC